MATKKAAASKPLVQVPSERYVALLRGINLGPNNKLPMPALCALLEQLGAGNVKHYIQSGNLAFDASATLAASIALSLNQRISADWGFDIPVVLRKQAAIVRVLQDNPFLADTAEPKALHVAFLSQQPLRAHVAALDPARSVGDEFAVLGSEIYLRLPNGVARSKLTNAYFDRALGSVSTIRNWNTVRTLSSL